MISSLRFQAGSRRNPVCLADFFRSVYRDACARQEMSLLVRTAVYRVADHIGANAAVVKQSVALAGAP